MIGDWTVDQSTGRSNSSVEFLRLCREVEALIRNEAHTLISGHADISARLIMAQLAHVHGLVPCAFPGTPGGHNSGMDAARQVAAELGDAAWAERIIGAYLHAEITTGEK